MPTIPPLVCNTPPPIDDLESDDDLSAPNDCNDHFDDESLPPSPQQQQKQQNTANTILVRNSLSPSPEMTVTHKPAATNTTAESPISLELELESQIVNDGLDSQSSVVVADDELQFDSDKVRAGSDSAIGDVYSNGQCSNSSIITSKETDTSNSSVDLKRSESLADNNDHPISVHATDGDDDDDDDNNNGDDENGREHALPAIEQSDNLSSSPSWNLDGQTPEPEFNSFSMPGELSSIEHSSTTMIANTEHHTDTMGFVDDCHHSNTELSLNETNDEKFVATTSVSPTTIVNDAMSNANDGDSLSECGEDEMGAIKFNADFGQFATFDDEQFSAMAPEPAVASAASTTIEPTNKCDKIQAAFSQDHDENSGEGSHTNTNDYADDDDDDDDEFGEFNDFQQMPAPEPTTSTSAAVDTAATTLQKDVTPSANVLLDSENIKHNLSSILNAIFPADKQNCDATAAAAGPNSEYTYEKRQFINNLTVQLRNVENSAALNHQWAKSTSKTLLVKALGIDSRNILYGEKWNSSAPKFAANLGLSPLEPMKVTALSATSTSTSSSVAIPSALSAVDSDIKGHKSILEVPAAQFDWNSSGLINPLDALHAHTLLLDLEQLVVVANLDKINLNSSSSACSATNLAQNNYQPSISKSTITTSTAIATATITTSLSSSTFKSQPYQIVSALPLNESKLAKITNQRSTKTTPTAISTTTPSSSSPSSLDNLNQFNKTNFIKCTNGIHAMRYDTNHVKPLVTGNPFDSYFRAQNSTHEDQLPLDHQKATQRRPPSKSLASDVLPPLVSSNLSSPPLSAPVVDTVSMVRPTMPQSLDDVHSEEIASDTTSPTSDSYSYTVPGSSGMKETHIFTPVTPKSVGNAIGTSSGGSGTVAPVPIQPAGPVTTNLSEPIVPSLIPNGIVSQLAGDNEPFQSDTIVIKENVVKKEYRDVEYEPNKFANASADDFSEFQFAQPTQSMPTSNPIVEQKPNAKNVSSNSMSFIPDIYDKSGHKSLPNDRNVNSFDGSSSTPAIDAAEKPSMNTGNQSEFDLYSINKSAFPPSSYSNAVTATNATIEQFGRATDPMEIFSIQSTQQHHSHSAYEQSPHSTITLDTQQTNTRQNSPNNNHDNNNTMPFTNDNNNTVNNSMISISSIHSHPTSYIGGSNILMPQTIANSVQSKQTSAASNALAIQWPEPGINTDQLEQLEARFFSKPDSNIESIKSDTKSTVAKDNDVVSSSTTAAAATDDEWSDFVSVVQPQTPITNILNKNLLKHQNNDEDDWSEFVSSTPAPNSLHQFAPPPQSTLLGINVNNATAANSNYNNVFKPWTTNTTPFPQKNHTASYHPNSAFDGYAKSSNSQRYAKTVNTIANGDASHAFQNVMHKSSVAAPSIISLPDLGFVAPKSLVNMPNRSLAKK